MTTLEQAKIQIELNGTLLPVGHPVLDGKFHRYGPKNKYWYKLHEVITKSGQQLVFGSYGFWQGDNENTENIAMDWTDVTPEDRANAEAKRSETERREAAKKAQEASNAAIRAGQQWQAASREGESPYAARKQVTAPGVRYQQDGTMLIPLVVLERGEQPRLVGLQKIDPSGEKRYNAGVAKQGACCPVGRITEENSVLFIAEGWATARSISMATEGALAGYVAFDAGNILPIAQMARLLYPDMHILLCADDDFLLEKRAASWLLEKWKLDCPVVIDGTERVFTATDGAKVKVLATWRKDARGVPFIEIDARAGRKVQTGTFANAGLARATEAARAVGNASIVCPRFSARGDNKWTDFNDLHVHESLDAVRGQLAAAIMAAFAVAGDDEQKAEVAAAQASATPASNVVPLSTGNKSKKKTGATAAGAAPGAGEPPEWPGGGDGEPAGEQDRDWIRNLARAEKSGAVLPTLSNVYMILDNHSKWNGVIAYDEFSGVVVKLKNPPFAGAELGEWSDMDDLRCTLWMQQKFGFAPRQDVVMGAVLLIADLHKYHVVRNYLNALQWDGQPRLKRWLVDRLGAQDIPYNEVVALKWLVAAVARIYKPGCKADNVLILEGDQGIYKSTALKVLGGEWFTDAPFRLGDKDAYIVIRGKWLVELAELDSFNKAESTGAKLFFGQYVDRYRSPYGKRAIDVPRQQLFAGTTNSDAYLKDDTGNRRYWPVKVTRIDLEGLKAERDQIWAEAVHEFRAGTEWWPTSAEKDMFEEQQDERYVGDAYTSLINAWLVGKNSTTMTEILGECLKLDTAKWTRPEQQRVGRCMSEIGWTRVKASKAVAGKREWSYKRPEEGGQPAPAHAQQEDDDEPY
ncbi:VapE domain-containing protein [Duganella sp. CT11-25]|uniref:VapE domain-containing protein n=1 Tax=unclassified Duganella TaxID=2636909 RepID=UPI0039B0E08E